MLTIISGGQSGVDRAALDAALELNVACGGWCPQGRLAEDGPIAERYPLTELPGAGYLQRTEKNVLVSDATLIIHFGELTGGTARTEEFCRLHAKPCLQLDGESLSTTAAAVQVEQFIKVNAVQRLNVAGPRASGDRRAYPYTKRVLKKLLQALIDHGAASGESAADDGG